MKAYLDIGAEFSPDRIYRYRLWRVWGDGPRLMVIGLNPSTADETADDPTVRRCIGYARQWGFDGLEMTNLFAFRATDPRTMKAATDPFGPHNFGLLGDLAVSTERGNGAVLAAWGAHGAHLGCGNTVRERLDWFCVPVACLGTTNSGQPRHPLYLPKSAQPEAFIGDGGRLVTGRNQRSSYVRMRVPE